MRAINMDNMVVNSALPRLKLLGKREKMHLSNIPGSIEMAKYPPTTKYPTAETMGIRTLPTVTSPVNADNWDRTTRAIISSITAAAMIN
mmetsp:Transcript_22942/g.26164  ORF Transcript_22942/g.26164 Transcript_22942/m.26164 type:complete len:89 (+) Transcript_22942:1717-1983(+)